MKRNCPVCGKSQVNLSTHLSRIHHLDGAVRKQWLEKEKLVRVGGAKHDNFQRGMANPPTGGRERNSTQQTGMGLDGYDQCDEFKLIHPFTCMISGMTGSARRFGSRIFSHMRKKPSSPHPSESFGRTLSGSPFTRSFKRLFLGSSSYAGSRLIWKKTGILIRILTTC